MATARSEYHQIVAAANAVIVPVAVERVVERAAEEFSPLILIPIPILIVVCDPGTVYRVIGHPSSNVNYLFHVGCLVYSRKVVPLDEDYVDHELHMTRARRFSRFMSQFSWYYPHVESEDPNKPSLDKAWAYFEHVALPRYMTQSSNNANLAKAAPGENAEETKLYPVLSTSEADLADFGIAVGVYFYTLKGLALIMFLAAAINIPVMMYYRSNAYNPGNGNLNRWSLQSSAICTNQEWAPCPTCQLSDGLVFPKTYTRYAETTLPSGQTLPFILLNNCNMSETVGIWSFVSLIFVTVAVFVLREISKRKEKEFDDAQLTTPDYGVEIENPPFDARDPDEWKEFFSQFGPVNTITVVLDNEELTNILVKRRKLVNGLENLLPAGVKFDRYDLEGMASQAMPVRFLGKLMCKSSAPKLLEKIAAIDKLVMEDLALRKYNVSEVFVVFETEEAKTSCLNGLAVTGVAMLRNDTSALPPERIFRGKHLLSAVQPPEPTSVRRNDLDETFWTRMCQRTITMLITVLLVAGTCVAVIAMRKKYGVVASALTITVSEHDISESCCLIVNDVLLLFVVACCVRSSTLTHSNLFCLLLPFPLFRFPRLSCPSCVVS